jgi:hypothetical protein
MAAHAVQHRPRSGEAKLTDGKSNLTVDTRTPQAFMGHRSIANTVVYTAVADKRIGNIWGK